jgi:hypothetical protein
MSKPIGLMDKYVRKSNIPAPRPLAPADPNRVRNNTSAANILDDGKDGSMSKKRTASDAFSLKAAPSTIKQEGDTYNYDEDIDGTVAPNDLKFQPSVAPQAKRRKIADNSLSNMKLLTLLPD